MSEGEASRANTSTIARAILARRSTRWLLALAALAVVLRVALPYAARRIAVSQADQALAGRVEIADLDFAVFAGGLTIHGLRMHADERPEPRTAPTAPAPSASAAGLAPIFAADRAYVNLAWLALLRKTVEVEAIEVDRFAIDVERAGDGTLVLPQPARPEEPEAPEPDDEGEPWGFVIDRIALRDGRLHFRDRAVGDPPHELAGLLPNLDARDLALVVTDAEARPGTMVLDAAVRDGALHLESTMQPRETGQAFESRVVLTNLPIDDARAYIPDVGWTALRGRLDLDLTHRSAPEGVNLLLGKVALRELAVHVDGLDEAALAWGALGIEIEGVDLVKQHASIGAVTLDGTQLIVNAQGDEPLPVLRGLVARDPDSAAPAPAGVPRGDEPETEEPDGEPAPANADVAPKDDRSGDGVAIVAAPAATDDAGEARPADNSGGGADVGAAAQAGAAAQPARKTEDEGDVDAPANTEAAESRPWTWDVASVTVHDSRVTVLGGDAPLPLELFAEASALASEPGTRSSVKLELTLEAGSIALSGRFAIDPLAFDGKVQLDALSLPALAGPVATPATRLLASAFADGELSIAAGDVPQAPRDGAQVSGTLRLRNLEVVGDDPATFALRWESLAVEIAQASAPGVLAPQGSAPAPIEVKLASVTLDRPEIVATRTADGIALPDALGSSGSASNDAAAAGAGDKGAADAGARPAAAHEDADGRPSAPVAVQLAKLEVGKMRVSVTDSAVKPAYRGVLDPIDVSARDVAWPGPRAADVKVTAKGLDGATFTLSGDVAPEGSELVADLAGLPLAPFHSYAAPSGYGLGGGVAAVRSNIKLGPGSYEAESKVVLNELQVTGSEGDSLFAAEFGMPLSLALALMTDLQGNIALTLPVTGDRSGTRFAIGKIVRDALARAILNAATSPLKLIGAVANIGDKPASLAPQPVAFLEGRAELADDEAEKLEQLGKLLASTPSVTLRLRAEASDADRRWLAEQKLRAELEEDGGLLAGVRHLGERGERKSALDVLEKRAGGKDADVPEDHREWFERNVARQNVSDAEIARLVRQRAQDVRARLLEAAKGVAPERVVVEDPAPEDFKARAVVAITLGTTG